MKKFIDITQKLKGYLNADPNVIFAFIFGSAAIGKAGEKSDIDIAIYFEQPPEGMDLLHLISTLSELVGKDVDVVVLNTASAFLRHQVMKHKMELTIKDRERYRRFREKTISDYDEYKYVAGMNVYDR